MTACTLLLVACATLPASTEADIRALEQRQAQMAMAGNRAALEQIFAPDFRLINPSGAIATREELLRLLGSGTPPYRKAVYVTDTVRVHDDVVVTTGTEDVEYAADGRPQRRRVTHVWERRGDAWQLVLRQATLVTP
jgi:ketosteroid isomerase-like protein